MKSKIKLRTLIILILIIAVSLVRITYVFGVEKGSFHSDEVWSFGLSNSYYHPFLYCNDERTELENFNEWKTQDFFNDYLTVQEDERFTYGSVFYNQTYDDHPPLFYLLLHTVCSIFPNTYTLWYAFFIVAIAFVILMIFGYRLAKLMTGSDFFALSFAAFLGLCNGVVNMFTFVRMYSLATAFFTAYMFYMLRLIKTSDLKKNVPFLVLFVFLGAYTHHFFLAAAGILTFLVCLYFLIKRKFKILFISGLSILGGVALSVLLFPATIKHLLSGQRTTTMPPFVFSFKGCLQFTLSELFGIKISPYYTMTDEYVFAAIIISLAIFIPIGFLLRKNEWVKKNIFTLPKKIYNFFKSHRKKSLVFAVICILTSLGLMAVVAKIVNLMAMRWNTDRYLFVIYPAFAIGVAYIIYELLTHIIKKHKWIPKTLFCIILAAFVVFSTINTGYVYLFPRSVDDVHLSDVVTDSDVILALGESWKLTYYSTELLNTNKVFTTTFDYVEITPDEVINGINENASSNKPLYLAINTSYLYDDYKKVDKDDLDLSNLGMATVGHDKDKIMSFFKGLEVASKFEYVGRDELFCETVDIYKLRD